jgi:pyruvate kinase
MKRARLQERRTRIIATLGPASSTAATVERLVRAGISFARFNLAHDSHQEQATRIETVRRVSRRLGVDVGILIDIPGPKYRTGKLKDGTALLQRGAEVLLTGREVIGDAAIIAVSDPSFAEVVATDGDILLDDGAMRLRVLSKRAGEVRCRVIVGGTLGERRGLAVPGARIAGPFISQQFRADVRFAVSQRPDYLAISFVGTAGNMKAVKALLGELGAAIPLIAKIERGEAVANFDEILEVSDGIMVARGDLGVDIPLERVPLVQRAIIAKCNRAGKPVITATEMLESMVASARPTRAEVSDVANAIFDGTDATMLSAETAVGRHPVAAVRIMGRIAIETERQLPYDEMLAERAEWLEAKTEELISYDACQTAHYLGAAAIVAFTKSGSTVGRVAKYRPGVPVLAITSEPATIGRVLLHWGVHPHAVPQAASVEELFAIAVRLVKELDLARRGDLIVITGGIPIGVTGRTNLLKVEEVG